jgi:hypothetical protein
MSTDWCASFLALAAKSTSSLEVALSPCCLGRFLTRIGRAMQSCGAMDHVHCCLISRPVNWWIPLYILRYSTVVLYIYISLSIHSLSETVVRMMNVRCCCSACECPLPSIRKHPCIIYLFFKKWPIHSLRKKENYNLTTT